MKLNEEITATQYFNAWLGGTIAVLFDSGKELIIIWALVFTIFYLIEFKLWKTYELKKEREGSTEGVD